MADDILLSPEEQDERARQWVKENGFALLIGIVVGLGAIFAYNQYKAKQQQHGEQASELFNIVLTLSQESDNIDISDNVTKLKQDFPSTPYAAKAVLLQAGRLAVKDADKAIAEYQWVIDNASESGLQHSARIRLAKLYLLKGETDKAISLAQQQPYEGFDSHYHEILGDAAVKQKRLVEAGVYYQKAFDSLSDSSQGYGDVLTMKMSKLPPAPETAQESEKTGIETIKEAAADEQDAGEAATEQ